MAACPTPNEGTLDRALRILLGLFLISLIFWGPQTLWGLMGIVPLLTGFGGFCPLYRPLGLDTRGKKAKQVHSGD